MLLGLRAKLTFAIVLLIVVFAGFFGLYFPAQQEDIAEDALRLRARSVSRAFEAIGSKWLESDREYVADVLRQFVEDTDSDIAYIIIQGSDGGIFAAYGAPDVLSTIERRAASMQAPFLEPNGEHIQITSPIYDEGVLKGTITTGLSRRSIDAARRQSRGSALLVSAVILLVGMVVSWLVAGGIATPILAAAQELDGVSGTLVAAARDQEASAAQEAAAVAETRRSMETLLDSAQQIADRSSEVLGNAERSTNGSQQIAQRIGNLNELSEKIAEILGVIMQVADKADLLALNASLEGTRAGDAGKGFALVAAEMRRLAENVVESVSGIRELMKDMRDASQSAVVASQEGTKSSTATTHSAREIALLTQEQRQATEQVMASMDEMGDILNHTLDGIQRTTVAASGLTELAGKLSRMVNPALTRRNADDKLRKDPDTI